MTIPSATPTLIPRTTTIPTSIITEIPTATPVPVYTAIEPEWTQPPTVYLPAEKDITKINFTQFKNDNFIAEYPATWILENDIFEVRNNQVTGQDLYKPLGNRISFISEDRNTRMIVKTYDFIAPALHTYSPTIDTARRVVALLYPSVNSESAVYNYQYTQNRQGVFTATYDVVMPNLSYRDESFVTYNHYFEIQFIVTNSSLEDYRDLKYWMMNSVVTEGMQTGGWW